MSTRTVMVNLQANVAGYMASMRAASAATAQMAATAAKSTAAAATPMKKLGEEARMLPMGLSATTTAMGALAVGVGLSAKAAIDWDSAWAGVTKTVDGSPEQMAALEAELRGLAKTLPATHEEIAGVAEAAGQLGIERENIASFTKTMIDLGETTNLSAEQAATSLARFMNIMGTSQDEVSNLGSSVVELGNNFETTEAEIVDMAMRIAGAGRQIGMSEGDVLGLATALSSVGIESEAGGTAISRVMIDMAKAVDTGSDKLAIFAQVAGQSTGDFTAAFRDDAAGALTAFIEGLSRVQESGASTTPILEALDLDAVRVGDTLRRASANSEGFAEALATGNDAYRENSAMADEAAKRYETLASRLDVAKNKAKDMAITVGGPLAEAFVSAIEPIAAAIDMLDRFNQKMPEVTVGKETFKFDIFQGVIPMWIDLIALLDEIDIAQGDVVLSGAEMAARFNQAGENTRFLNRAAADTQEAVGGASGAIEDVAASVDDLGQSAEDASAEIDAVADAIRGLGGTSLDARAAQRELAQAVDDAQASFDEYDRTLAKNGKTINLNSEAGRANEAALDAVAVAGKDAAASAFEHSRQTKGLNRSQKDANKVIQDARQRFIDMAVKMGASKTAAERLADKAGLVKTRLDRIPKNTNPKITLTGADGAIADAARVQASLLNIKDRYVSVFVSEVRRDSARASNARSGIQPGGGYRGGWATDISPGFAAGGWVSGAGSSTSDSIPAWLSRGEFVINAASAANNAALLEAINRNGRAPVGGDTVIINATTESIAREIESRQRIRALARRVA